VLRDTAAGGVAATSRRLGLLVVVACALAAAGACDALAQQGTTSNPAEELWRDYPLEQTATSTAQSPPAAEPRRTPSSEDSSGPWWIAVVAGAGAALAGIAFLYSRRRRPSPEPALLARPMPPPAAPAALGTPLTPARPTARPRPAPRTAATQNGPVCQIRWSRRGGFFIAVTTEADGSERGIARSPRFDWDRPTPPEPEQEPEAALRVLSKELRDKGWRPLRAKGFDFDQRRWYARRFKLPTEGSAT
jgi:hypothetical protein